MPRPVGTDGRSDGSRPWSAAPPSLREIAAGVWRSRRVILLSMLATLLCTAVAVVVVTPHYTAQAKLLVLLSSEYAVRRDAGEGGTVNAILDRDAFLKAETEILTSPVVGRSVIGSVGGPRLYPDAYKAPGLVARVVGLLRHALTNGSGAARSATPEQRVLEQLDAHLTTVADKAGNVITVTFTHPDAVVAAEVVNATVHFYLHLRSEIYADVQSDAVAEQARTMRTRLDEAVTAYAAFKANNGIANYDTQRELLLRQRSDIGREVQIAESALQQAARRLQAIDRDLAGTASDVVLYRDTDLQARIDKLKTAIDELRLRESMVQQHYQEDARPLVELRAQIADAVAELARVQADRRPTVTRQGRNPVYDGLLLDQTRTRQEQSALEARVAAARQQLAETDSAIARLESNEVELQRLERERAVIEQNYRSILKTLEERQMLEGIAAHRLANIRPIENAAIPFASSRVRLTVLVAGVIMSLAIGVLAAILSHLLRRGFLSAEAVERSTGLPVLGVVPQMPGRAGAVPAGSDTTLS